MDVIVLYDKESHRVAAIVAGRPQPTDIFSAQTSADCSSIIGFPDNFSNLQKSKQLHLSDEEWTKLLQLLDDYDFTIKNRICGNVSDFAVYINPFDSSSANSKSGEIYFNPKEEKIFDNQRYQVQPPRGPKESQDSGLNQGF